MLQILKKINWVNTFFLVSTPLVAVLGVVFLSVEHQWHLATITLMLFWLVASGLAITAGYHRFLAHRTFQAKPLIKILLLIFGSAAFQGSALEWCTDHRNHHRYSETEKDPYNIKKGFWYAHIGWLFVLDTSKRDFSNVEDLLTDRWISWQHRHYTIWSLTTGFILPTLIAGFWGDWLGGFLLAGVLRTVINHHATFSINSICHTFGKRIYSLEQTGRDQWFTALFTYGEGFHNFHHQFPLDYRNGIRVYDYDPTKWFIWTLGKLRLATDLKVVSVTHLTRYRLKASEQALLSKFKQKSDAIVHYMQDYLTPLRQQILQVIARIEAIEKSDKIKEYRDQLKIAHYELKYSLRVW